MTDRQRVDALLDEVARLQARVRDLEAITDCLLVTHPSGLLIPWTANGGHRD